nr:tRNA 2-selenouridine(34) synthase MnmH [uncultured Rhodoferax sp.]
MSLKLMPAAQALAQLDQFDAVIDARSEGEYALDHLPGAGNWPTLHNDERITVGTLYKQVSPFEARKLGGVLAARNIASNIETHALDKPKHWAPLAYCWRGGQRSGSLSMVLDQIGFKVTLVQGGYKAFRAAMLEDIPLQAQRLQLEVVCGTTGCGKTRLLHALAAEGAQVLDLEGLANHRSSLLGAVPGLPQPTQKRFDTLVWDTLRKFDAARPVYVESESKKIGNLTLPTALVERMHASPCLQLSLPTEERIELLLEDYSHLVQDTAYFCHRLDVMAEFRGKVVVQGWKDQVAAGHFRPVVQDLLTQHYDPSYLKSMQNNFRQFGTARSITARDRSAQAMHELAQALLAP